MLLQIAAWLYGTSLAKLVGEVLIEKFGINLFPAMVTVLMPVELGSEKTRDLLVFGLTFLFAGIVFAINYWVKKRTKAQNEVLDYLFLGFSFLFFWQSYFVHSSRLLSMVVAIVVEVAFVLVSLMRTKKINLDTLKEFPWQNAVLAGYWLSTVLSLVTTSLLFRLSMVVLVLGVYLILFNSDKFKKFLGSPIQLLFLVTLFLPVDLNLVWFGLGVLALSVIEGFVIKKRYRISFFEDAAIIVLVTWNMRFFVGNYDFIEEGVWLGTLQRLGLGQVMYRDFFFYHPPLMPKFIYLLMQIFGESVYSLRLSFEILRVLGLIFYFYLIKEVLEGKAARIILFLIALGITSTLVRNNVEIRLGVGLLAILFWYKAIKLKNNYWLVGSGLVTAVAGLVSLEVGLATAIAIFLGLLAFGGRERIKVLLWWVSGGLLVTIPVILWMLMEGSLLSAIEQMSYYSKVFSTGYFNLSIPSTPVSAYYQWSLFDEYFSSQLFGWELMKLGLLLGVFLVITRMMEKKLLDEKEKLVTVLTLFGLTVSRSSLGRADWFHLLFGLLVALIILAVVFEKMLGKTKTALVLAALLIIFARTNGLRVHFDNLFLNWQTHGQVLGSVQDYDFGRMGVKVDVGVEVYKLNDIVKYLDNEFEDGEEVFMFPWMPDLYFFADLKNPTKNDLPYSFFTERYQKETIVDLEQSPDVPVIFNPLRSFAGFDAARLILLNEYIQSNYETVDEIGSFRILRRL